MSVFVQAARIIGTLTGLVGLGQQGAGVGLGLSGFTDGGFSPEYIAGGSTSVGGDIGAIAGRLGMRPALNKFDTHLRNMTPAERLNFNQRMSGGRVTTPASTKQGIKDFGKSASIILWTLTVVELLELTIGFGPPYEGSDLKSGAQQFATLSAQLKSALPDNDNWEGSGSEAYAELDTALQNMATTMAGLDNQLAALIEDQAEWINHMRLAFGLLKDALFAAFVIEMAMFFGVPPAGPLAAKIFAGTVCALGISAAMAFIGTLLYYSVTNGKKAQDLANQYAELAKGAVQTGSLAQASVGQSGQSTVSSFDAISGSMTGMSALAEIPTAAAPAKAGNGSKDDERAPLTAQSDAGETAGDGAPETPKTDKTTPPTSGVTMPTVAQLAQMSGQASNLSGQLSQHSQLVSQAMGQIQQLAQMGQQGQGAAAPAEEAAGEEEAALTADVEGTGAGTGAAGAERAPIQVGATAAERAPQPTPVERVL